MFTKVLAFYLSLPSNFQKFAVRTFYSTTEECFDAIGILFNNNELDTLTKEQLKFRINHYPSLCAVLQEQYDLTTEEATELHHINDGTHRIYEVEEVSKSETPEKRFNRVINWLRTK